MNLSNVDKKLSEIRPATAKDAQGMSIVLSEILTKWKSDRISDPDYVCAFYIEHPDNIQCSVAVGGDGTILGFQSLIIATVSNRYNVAPGWGIIGTYVKLDAGRQGIGSALFASSIQAAKAVGLSKIEAAIGADNKLGLNYYDGMGFKTYRETSDVICKCFTIGDHTR
ncbi:MAG: GNAT family N-acetyltransferase [Hyphomicrobiales bacterium]